MYDVPKKCRGCPTRQSWLDKPEGYTESPFGQTENLFLQAKADRICPGVSISLDDGLSGSDIEFSEGKAIISAEKIALHCEFFEAAYGDPMGS